MKKSDLRTGMAVEIGERGKYVVLKDVDTTYYGNQEILFIGKGGFVCGTDYNENLEETRGIKGFTITKVYSRASEGNLLDIEAVERQIIWGRKPTPIEMTLEEACKKLRDTMGRPVKITI
jgi:hypothetical protein